MSQERDEGRPRDFASAATPREGQEERRRATPTPQRRGEAGESTGGKAGGVTTSRKRDEGSSVVCRRERGRNFRFCFLCFQEVLRWVNFFVCSEKLAIFGVKVLL